jgi:hypothetical protein
MARLGGTPSACHPVYTKISLIHGRPKRYVRTHSQDAVHAIAEAAGILRRWAIFLRIAAHGNYMEFPS